MARAEMFCWVDGGSSHNGYQDSYAYGSAIVEGALVEEHLHWTFPQGWTSNDAEFESMRGLLEWLNDNIRDAVVTIYCDSRLVVEAMSYLWELRNERLLRRLDGCKVVQRELRKKNVTVRIVKISGDEMKSVLGH